MWFCSTEPKHLPKPTGPFQVSCIDLFTEHSEDGVMIRLYYPTMPVEEFEVNPKSWITWLPGKRYISGFAKMWSVPLWLSTFIFTLAVKLKGNIRIPIEYGNELMKQKNKYKCVVFSHGIGSTRFCYSAITTDMASRGFLVACVEHRDESSVHAWYYKDEEAANKNEKTSIRFRNVPFTHKPWRHDYRVAQMNQRVKENGKVLDFLLAAVEGNIPKARKIPDYGNKTRNTDFKFEDLKGNVDLDTLTIMGHSFGSSSSLLTLSQRKEFKQGIIMDPWMYPLKSMDGIWNQITQPLIFINTPTFNVDLNIKALKNYYTENPPNMYTIQNVTHEYQCDGVFVSGSYTHMRMKKLKGDQALKINNYLIYRFMKERINFPEDISDCIDYLNKEDSNIECGLPKPMT